MRNSNTSRGGVGFVGLLTIVFIALKVLGKITWSWWLVLSPIWIAMALTLAIVGVALLCIAVFD